MVIVLLFVIWYVLYAAMCIMIVDCCLFFGLFVGRCFCCLKCAFRVLAIGCCVVCVVCCLWGCGCCLLCAACYLLVITVYCMLCVL